MLLENYLDYLQTEGEKLEKAKELAKKYGIPIAAVLAGGYGIHKIKKGIESNPDYKKRKLINKVKKFEQKAERRADIELIKRKNEKKENKRKKKLEKEYNIAKTKAKEYGIIN